MGDIRSIEFHDNGKVKRCRIEFYEPKQKQEAERVILPIPRQWWLPSAPFVVTGGSTGAMDVPNLVMYQTTALRDWDTLEEDTAWAYLSHQGNV